MPSPKVLRVESASLPYCLQDRREVRLINLDARDGAENLNKRRRPPRVDSEVDCALPADNMPSILHVLEGFVPSPRNATLAGLTACSDASASATWSTSTSASFTARSTSYEPHSPSTTHQMQKVAPMYHRIANVQ
eukprot:5241926-Amphidinium_carterae.2